LTDFAPGVAPDPGLLRTHGGHVATFDLAVGVGEVESDDGAVYPFHCTAIYDGSRTIAPETRVRFSLTPGRLGQLEARDIVPFA
jgi:cold shock CspA family protein